MLKNTGRFFLLILLLGATIACHQNPALNYNDNPVTQNLSWQQQWLLKKIAGKHITVIKEGMLYTFIIPTDEFFDRQSQELKPRRENSLIFLARFINDYNLYFKKLSVSVIGYTDNVWVYSNGKKLSLHYANSVADALREFGVDVPLKVRGLSSQDPVASNQYPSGAIHNRRVVIKIF